MAAEVVEIHPASPQREQSRAERRHDRRRIEFIDRYGKAVTPREKLDAAADYFRGVTADHRVDPVKTALATEHLAERLIASADQLAKTIRRSR